MSTLKTFARNLRTLRKQAQLNQAQAAKLLFMSRQQYGKYERSESYPTIDVVDRVCDAYNIGNRNQLLDSDLAA